MIPPKPAARARRATLWRYWRMFREDILSAQPAHLYRAKMAEFKTPWFRSYLVNELALVRQVLIDRAGDFPKSDRVTRGLRPLLGRSVFVTNGDEWAHQRRIIDPAFEGGRVKESFPAMVEAALAAVDRIRPGAFDAEAMASHATADVIFRSLFSRTIDDKVAAETYETFRAFQRTQPVAVASALMPWLPVHHKRKARRAAGQLRGLIAQLVAERQAEIAAGKAPDDLATKIMTTPDPETGTAFSEAEMVDQVAIFFLAGHETSASALSWALYLMALYPDWQDRVAKEAEALDRCDFALLSKLRISRDVFRETLRLYPPVPMMVREATQQERFRDRDVPRGAQLVISPWHLHRHEKLWDAPDEFDPSRWGTENGKACQREAYIPFSAGPRVCTGAGFAMVEGVVLLSTLVRHFRFELVAGRDPVPVAHLTVRAKDGIWLRISRR